MDDARTREARRIAHIAEMLTDMREDSREEVKEKLEVHFRDLEANLQGYLAERIALHRAFIVELLMRPYDYYKKEYGLHLLAYEEIEGTVADVTEMLEDIMPSLHKILEHTEDF